MTVERGGQWQEDMDIRFAFIVGTPARDVLDVQQLWRADARGYVSIMADRSFEARDVYFQPYASQFKIKSTITGHGQQGEFNSRYHYLNINGTEEFNWKVWTECSMNPIYPQGGTWIYDRAGWCPGQASDTKEYDITDMVTPGVTNNIDYGVVVATGTSNYIVNNQLVTYGGNNFILDAAITQVLNPNSMDAKNDRFNPACSYPEIVIQNTGSTSLTSLDITYYEEGGESETFTWNGTLAFMESDTVLLPISDINFWLPSTNVFIATVSNPNGGTDEYEHNNTYKTHFEGIDVYPENQILNIVCKTNNYGWQTDYTLYEGDGEVYLEWDNLDDNTVYETPLILAPGCYQLRIDDIANDGLEFWANPNQGAGYFQLRDSDGNTLYNFEPDFGGYASYEFGIGNITSVVEKDNHIAVATYPNPSRGLINVHISGLEPGKTQISVFNTMNTELMKDSFSTESGELNTVLDISSYPSGIYLLKVESNSSSIIRSIIKK